MCTSCALYVSPTRYSTSRLRRPPRFLPAAAGAGVGGSAPFGVIHTLPHPPPVTNSCDVSYGGPPIAPDVHGTCVGEHAHRSLLRLQVGLAPRCRLSQSSVYFPRCRQLLFERTSDSRRSQHCSGMGTTRLRRCAQAIAPRGREARLQPTPRHKCDCGLCPSPSRLGGRKMSNCCSAGDAFCTCRSTPVPMLCGTTAPRSRRYRRVSCVGALHTMGRS